MRGLTQVMDGLIVDIDVTPNSKNFEITGYNKWRERLEVKVQSLPKKGKANIEIVKCFSNLTKHDVEIVSGHKSHLKSIKIFNISKEDFLDIVKLGVDPFMC
ncbi:MAG: DUF167 family protein [Methanobacteriaceae archaeon]|nr:DUF167 family protein [Methanobacteriaceae archaeon]